MNASFVRTLIALATTAGLAEIATAQDRVEELLNQMTLEEKAGQMTQLTLSALSSGRQWTDTQHELNVEAVRKAIVEDHVGSILNQFDAAFTPEYWREIITTVQTIATEETRLKIPVVYGVDSVHGANYVVGATIFPQNISLAATWNPSLSTIAGEVTAFETRAVGIPWNFSPVADVARQPLWSRYFETFGEDPYLVSIMAAESVKGQQQAELNVAACGKHFIAYSMPRSGKDRTPTQVGMAELLDVFAPPFQAMIDAGVDTMMINSGEINGVPVHASHEILTGLLRDRMGFEGVAVTDWEDVIKLHTIHKIADSEKEATRQAILAGIDMSMVPYKTDFADHIVALVNEGAISEERIDLSVRRILRLKDKLGLFEQPISGPEHVQHIGRQSSLDASLAAAREGVVLLKNNDESLPLTAGSKILVTGPTADALPPVYGAWSFSWQGAEAGLYPDTPTVLDAARTQFGAANVSYVPGASFNEEIDLAAVASAAADADAIVVCLGEPPSTEGPGDILELELEPAQLALAQAAIDTGKPVVLVLIVNRPRLFTEVDAGAAAVVWLGQPGPFGPQALAEVLAGELNPSGRLPFTYPRHNGSVVTYDRKWSEGSPEVFANGAQRPLYEFGSGLAYTTYGYSGMRVWNKGETLTVEVTVTNTGDRDGHEVVQLYVSDEYASVTPHVQRLKGFDKVALEAGESKTITFELTKDDLSIIDRSGRKVFEPGGFGFRIGDQATRLDWGN